MLVPTVGIFCPVYPRRCFSSPSCECSSSATTSCVHCLPPFTLSHTSDSWYDIHIYTHTHFAIYTVYLGNRIEFKHFYCDSIKLHPYHLLKSFLCPYRSFFKVHDICFKVRILKFRLFSDAINYQLSALVLIN